MILSFDCLDIFRQYDFILFASMIEVYDNASYRSEYCILTDVNSVFHLYKRR